jgi:hypothetical protein
MGSRKNKTVKKTKGGNNSPDFFGKKTFLDIFQKRYDHEKLLEDKLKKSDPNIVIVNGKDLKPGCTYKFIDPSIYNKEFIVKSIKKDPEQGPKTAAGEEYILTNEGWWIRDYPISGNDKFITQKCNLSDIELNIKKNKSISRKNKSRKNNNSA